MEGLSFALCISSLFSIFVILNASDTINESWPLRDGETIVSSSGTFELGFFSPGNSKNRYVGIWYKKIPVFTVVWVANREIPLTDTSGMLTIRNPGILVLKGTNGTIWSANTSRSPQNPVAQLLESGNFVLKSAEDDSPDSFFWQSFDYPGNTLLSGMKFGKNIFTGHEWSLSSWKSDDDPSRGDFISGLNTDGYPQYFIRDGDSVVYMSGPWNGLGFSGSSNLQHNNFYDYRVVLNSEEIYYSFSIKDKSVPFKHVLSPNGVSQHYTWAESKGNWVLYSSTPGDNCDLYASCGAYSTCKIDNSPICGCLDKFVPKNIKDWNAGDCSNGCVRRMPLDCQAGDGFLRYSGLKLPDTRNSWYSVNMTLEECRRKCLGNCSCMAYSNLDMRGKGSGCLLWFHYLVNMKDMGDKGQDIYVRMASLELKVGGVSNKRRDEIIVALALTIGTVILILGMSLFVLKKHKQLKKIGNVRRIFEHNQHKFTTNNENEDLSLRLFGLATIAKATNNFSEDNKLGEGGYGLVYKGMLKGGQEIAMKRLSRDSRQGLDEFKNEVMFIAKLQHRNLVKLLGCCIQREEKMLIYEYMPNNSLDTFLFDKTKSTILDWPMRFRIINGISRGLLYLHQDSCLRIIHRDLKTNNNLLDTEMNPKISDFGMARSFGGNEAEANTARVVGTYGYMSPEYAIHGIFSDKSDVFGFGVLVLEIVSGKRNRGFCHPDHSFNLLGHAWNLYREGKSSELIGDYIVSSSHMCAVLRSIHVALLCVQNCREDRPCMASVVLMLTSNSTLPQPKQPGFFPGNDFLERKCSPPSSVNDVTITSLDVR